ncbi:MAG: hypothetical protein RIK85_03270 [Marinobacter sp.]
MRAIVVGLLSGFAILLLVAEYTGQESGPQWHLSEEELEWIGHRVFLNECSGRRECLVHWNEGEAFPSLGIGHFIWYPEGVNGRFVESFPALIAYMEERAVDPPEWLGVGDIPSAPWPDREAFLRVSDSSRVAGLRQFLADTKGLQVAFIFERAQSSLAAIVAAAPDEERSLIRRRLAALTATPGGAYALIDYVNFKGEGLSPGEAYHGEGWGLLQVLRAMSGPVQGPVLAQFREAAAEVLTRRANNASNPIEKERWLPGWLKRLNTYREPPESLL